MGDAAFGMTGLDFETAVRCGAPITTVVFDDSAMAIERHALVVSHERYRTVDIGGHYADMGRAMGGCAERVEQPEEIAGSVPRPVRRTRSAKPSSWSSSPAEEMAFFAPAGVVGGSMILHALPRPLLGLLVMLVWLAGCATYGEPPTLDASPAETAFSVVSRRSPGAAVRPAVTAFTETLALTPNRVEAYHDPRGSLSPEGGLRPGARRCTQALRLNPDYAKAYYARGIVHSNKGAYDEAFADYTQALTLNRVLHRSLRRPWYRL